LPESAFEKFPREELYIVQGRVPPEKMETPRQPGLRTPAQTHRYPLMAQEPRGRFPGGAEWLVSAREFPVSTTVTGVILDLEPGAVREPHWHPHANEWQYYISGKARVGLFGSSGRSRMEEFSTGDAGYIPQGMGHYIENIGDSPCRILIAFDSGEYQEISLSRWLATNPTHLVADNFKIDDATAEKFPDHRVYITPKEGAPSRDK
jgi:oxalate decarboxylase